LRVGWISPSPLLPTGLGKVSYHVIKHLVSKGYEVYIANPQYGGRPVSIEGAWHYPLIDFTLLSSFLDSVKPEVVVAYGSCWYPPYNQISRICSSKNIPLLWYCTVEFTTLPLQFLQSLVGATHVATTSFFGKKVLEEHNIEASVIPHGVDRSVFKPMNPKPRFESQEDKFVFGMVARNSLRKEYPVLLKAFSLLPEEVKRSCVLYLHTLPIEESNLRGWDIPQLVVKLNLQGKVMMPSLTASKFWGFSDEELAQTYNALDAHILVSSGESFCLPVLEAMACGIPQAVSNNTALPEVVGDAALTIECWEEEMYTAECFTINTTKIKDTRDKMLLLYEDEDLRKKLSEKALERAKEYTWEKAGRALEEALEETASKNKRIGMEVFRMKHPIEAEGFNEHSASFIPSSKKHGKLLDVGCGVDKPYKKHVEAKGYVWVGVDKKGGRDVIQLDLAKLPLPFGDKEFEFVFCNQVIEHIPTSLQFDFLKELMRVGEHGVVKYPLESNINFWLDPSHNKVDNRVMALSREVDGEGVVTW